MTMQIQPNQLWTFKNNTPNEKYVFIRMFCPFSGSDYVHIAILDEKLDVTVAHAPFCLAAVTESLGSLIRSEYKISLPGEGFEIWAEAFSKGKAGYYSTSVAEAVTV